MRCLDHQHHLWSFRNANSWVPLQTYWIKKSGKSRDSCLCLNKPSRWFQDKLKFKYCCSGELSLIPSEANQQPKLWISFPLIFSGLNSISVILSLSYIFSLSLSILLTDMKRVQISSVQMITVPRMLYLCDTFPQTLHDPEFQDIHFGVFFSSTFLASFSLSPFLTHLFFSAIKCWAFPFLSYTGHFLSKFLYLHCFEYHL